MKTFPTALLVLCGIGFLAFGFWMLVDPGALQKVGIASTSKTGQIELRAFYGGMELGLGAFLLLCAARPGWRVAGLWLVLLANGGAGLARLLAIGLAGASVGGYLAWALAWELGFSALAALALFRHSRL